MESAALITTIGRVLLGWLLLAALFAGAWAGVGRRWRRRRRAGTLSPEAETRQRDPVA